MRIWAQEFQKFWKQMHAIYGWHKVEIRLNQKRIFWYVEPCCPLDRYWFYQGATCFLYVENKPHGQNKKVKKKIHGHALGLLLIQYETAGMKGWSWLVPEKKHD